jgi:hypothetical protein
MTRHDHADELPRSVAEAVREDARNEGYVADEALLARIQRSRASGARGLLPMHDTRTVGASTSHGRWRSALVAAGVAAIVVGRLVLPASDVVSIPDATPVASTRGSADTSPPEAPSPNAAAGGLADLLSPWPRVAYAQTPKGGRAGPFAAMNGLQANRVKLGRRMYVRLSGNAYHDLLPHETYELEVDTAQFDGKPVLRLVTRHDVTTWMQKGTSRVPPISRRDTVWLDRARLSPIARHSVLGPLEVTQRFVDTVLQQRTLMDTRKMGLKNPPKPVIADDLLRIDASRPLVVSEPVLRVLLQAAPLNANWKASVGVMGGEPSSIATLEGAYRNLRVGALDTLQTYFGRFPVWRVEVDNGRFPEVWYVSQETGEVLRTSGPWNGSTYPQSESHLIGGFSETKRLVPVKRGERVARGLSR